MDGKNIFPIELNRAIKCLADDSRQEIISKLTNTRLAYTELKNQLGFTNGNLNHHLSELIKAGIINRYLGLDEPGPYEKYYSLTNFGHDLLEGLFNSLLPSTSQQPRTEQPYLSASRHAVVAGIAMIMTSPITHISLGSGSKKMEKELVQ